MANGPIAPTRERTHPIEVDARADRAGVISRRFWAYLIDLVVIALWVVLIASIGIFMLGIITLRPRLGPVRPRAAHRDHLQRGDDRRLVAGDGRACAICRPAGPRSPPAAASDRSRRRRACAAVLCRSRPSCSGLRRASSFVGDRRIGTCSRVMCRPADDAARLGPAIML